jgi:hypothetical protein
MDHIDYYEEFDESLEIVSLVESMKAFLDINKPNSEMSDAEIKAVAREIGKLSEDTTFDDYGKPIFGHKAIDWMKLTVLYCFPNFWTQYKFAQFN